MTLLWTQARTNYDETLSHPISSKISFVVPQFQQFWPVPAILRILNFQQAWQLHREKKILSRILSWLIVILSISVFIDISFSPTFCLIEMLLIGILFLLIQDQWVIIEIVYFHTCLPNNGFKTKSLAPRLFLNYLSCLPASNS